ncbi:MAG: TonB-dependent receptor [Prolixibacteraceae bacterium]
MKKKWFQTEHKVLFPCVGKFLKIMKISIFLVLLVSLQTFAVDNYAQTKRIDIKIETSTIVSALEKIENASEFHFFYNNQVVKLDKVVSIDLKNKTINEILDELFKDTDVEYTINNKQIILSQKEARSSPTLQQKSVSGKVTDSSGATLPGVSVVVKGTTNGTITNGNGNYSITNYPENAILQFSFVGMTTLETKIGNQSIINAVLEESTISIENVVVIGYGSVKKSDLTGSVSSIQSDQLVREGAKINVLQSLQGMVPGLSIRQTSSDAAQDSYNILIRGRNSIKASSAPLIILDGVPYVGGLNEIDQGDVKSIDILKDASSTAIYGARGANGVILITTKKGTTGKPKIQYEMSFGAQQIYSMPEILSGEEYWNFAVDRVGSKVINNFPTLVKNHQLGKSVNWLDLATRNGQQQKHSIKLSGGQENVHYFLSGTYSDVKGIAMGDNFKEFVFRSNLSVNLTKWLEVGVNSQYTTQDQSGLAVGGDLVYMNNPLINALDDNGGYSVYPWPEEPTFTNPMSNLNVKDEDYVQRLFINSYAEIKFPFLKGLSYKFNSGYTTSSRQTGRFWGNNTLAGLVNGGQAYTYNSDNKDILVENIISYQNIFGKHNINFTGLYSNQNNTLDIRSLTTQGFPTETLTWYQPDVAKVIKPSSSYIEQKYISQMARLVYSYDSKYLVTLSTRRDGYSGFGKDNKFGIFPSVALGWNISNEKFLSSTKFINSLKFRLSFGENGNQAINPYQTLAKLQASNYLGGNDASTTAAGYYPSSLATPGLSWETSTTLNSGLDFQILKSRIIGSIDIYKTRTTDLLLDRAISSVHGITTITQNIGETENRGIELFVNSKNIQKGKFHWDTEFTFSHNKNKIIDLYGNGSNDILSGWFIGKPIDANYDYVFDGVWQTGDNYSLQPDAKPGDLKIKDSNGDGKINSDDRDFIGQSSPKSMFSLTNIFVYKDFSLSFQLFCPIGATRYNPLWDTDIVMVDARMNTIKLNWWRTDNPTNEYPANRNSTNPYLVKFYQDASYVRLRDVTLSYALPERMAGKIGLKNLRIYGNIKNGLTFSKWKGLDPELSNQRGTPLDRTFVLGFSLGF